MYVVMICGGMGSGKSLALDHLVERGATPLSLDDLSHELLQNSDAMRDQIISEFGEGICDDSGDIVPARLAAAAFTSPERAEQLNAITFPYLIDRTSDFILSFNDRAQKVPDVLAIEVPLLEKAPRLKELADEVLAIAAPKEARVERAARRIGDRADAEARIDLQAPDEERTQMADTVIVNDGTVDDFLAELDRWWDFRAAMGWHR